MSDCSNTSKAELVSLWTKQLYLEYEKICFSYRIAKVSLTIEIIPSTIRLGFWDASLKKIGLSNVLMDNFSWDIVIEVLKHEIAHHLTDISSPEALPHGPEFQANCQRLGVEIWARKSSLNLSDLQELDKNNFSAEPSAEAERMLRKAKKLMALARSDNHHEASEAMNKVQQLFETYHVHSLQELDKPDLHFRKILLGKRRTLLHQTMIANLLAEYFFVQVIHSSLYDPRLDLEQKVIEVFGSKENAELAEYVYWFVENQISLLWRQYQKDSCKKGARSKNQFYQGAVEGFASKLELQRVRRTANMTRNPTNHLVALDQESDRVKQYIKTKHPRIHTKTINGRCSDFNSRAAGFKKGRKLNLHLGVQKEKSGRTLGISAKNS